MERNTSVLELYILPFFMKADDTILILSVVFFLVIYLIGILLNIIIITAIYLNINLHTPMYLLLCNFSITDIWYMTVTVPKLLYMLISGDNLISFTQCLVQIYFFYIAASTEIIVIFIMAYDRYVAICHPLHYYRIFHRKVCLLIMMAIWIGGCVNSSLLTSSMLKLFFCSSVTIHQIFCDAKALINISCSGIEMFFTILYGEYFAFGLWPVMCNLMSYVKIVQVILRIKSKDGRSKAFSTCSSHLMVMVIYYASCTSVYMIPPSDRYSLLEQILTVFYTTVVPMMNPFIYSLRNKEVKNSLHKLLV